MFTRFDSNKSTKGASKLRRDLINAEIANLRDLLPLPPSTRQRLSQLQLMALVCVYVRKANYFQQVFKKHETGLHNSTTPNIGFSKALSGFLMMMTQNGKLLYISDNAAEYLGHSMEDLLIHGDSVYDIIDKQDHQIIQAELGHGVVIQPQTNTNVSSRQIENVNVQTNAQNRSNTAEGERKMFLCRMNVSRNARRQMRFGDQKVVLVQGHFLSFLSLCSRNEPVFLATCSPVAMPETRECVVHGATNVFTTIHTMDMKVLHVDKNGEFHLGFTRNELQGASWYQLLHWEIAREAQSKHRLITQSEQDRSCILLVRMQRRAGDWLWVHCVLQVKNGTDSAQQPVIVCTNQVLSDREAAVMRLNGWLYSFYSVQNKLQYGLTFETSKSGGPQSIPSISVSNAYYPSHSFFSAEHQLAPGTSRYEPVNYSLEDSRCRSPAVKNCSPIKSIKSEAIAYTICTELPQNYRHSSESDNTLVLRNTVPSAVSTRLRFHKSAVIIEQHDLEWNPSPPWSDTPQKVPDLGSPFLLSSSTPPTPTSAVSLLPQHQHQSSFSFDWTSVAAQEQHVVPKMTTRETRRCSTTETWKQEQIPLLLLQDPPHVRQHHQEQQQISPKAIEKLENQFSE